MVEMSQETRSNPLSRDPNPGTPTPDKHQLVNKIVSTPPQPFISGVSHIIPVR